jgi:hypothetical protein
LPIGFKPMDNFLIDGSLLHAFDSVLSDSHCCPSAIGYEGQSTEGGLCAECHVGRTIARHKKTIVTRCQKLYWP